LLLLNTAQTALANIATRENVKHLKTPKKEGSEHPPKHGTAFLYCSLRVVLSSIATAPFLDFANAGPATFEGGAIEETSKRQAHI
jgi:hypothetical protein